MAFLRTDPGLAGHPLGGAKDLSGSSSFHIKRHFFRRWAVVISSLGSYRFNLFGLSTLLS
jgi:hypothetical protein